MNWWCSTTRLPWDWAPRFYPGVWLFVVATAVSTVVVVRRSGVRLTGRQRLAGWAGLSVLWASLDWPLGTLGSGYLVSVHMVQYMLISFLAAPLLILAVPEDLARVAMENRTLSSLYRVFSRPLAAGIAANFILVATHVPVTVDFARGSQIGSFVLDVIWILGGLALWLPVAGPLPEFRPSYPVRCIYLFLAAGVLPMLPGGFLTFAEFPLYSIYEMAPRVSSIDPISDQQAAGALMKVGSLPTIWPVIAVMFWRWARAGRYAEPFADSARTAGSAVDM